MRKSPSALYQLIEDRLDVPLTEFVAERRRADQPPFGAPTPWQSIADEIGEKTGVKVNRYTLRLWFADSETAAVQ